MTVSKSENLSPNTNSKTQHHKRFDDQPLLHSFKTDTKLDKHPNLMVSDMDESDSPLQMTYTQEGQEQQALPFLADSLTKVMDDQLRINEDLKYNQSNNISTSPSQEASPIFQEYEQSPRVDRFIP